MGVAPCCFERQADAQTPRRPESARDGRLSARKQKSAGDDVVPGEVEVRLERVPPPASITEGPRPEEIAELVREWISKARDERAANPPPAAAELIDDEEVRSHRREDRRRPAESQQSRQERELEGTKHLFGTLDVTDAEGRCRTFDVAVQLRRFLTPKQRCLIIHLIDTEDDRAKSRRLQTLVADRGRKQAAMVYCEAATGAFHGIHIANEHRGCGLMKPAFLYYVLFCREFGLSTSYTADNKKPLFASLFRQMGYQPCSAAFPFLLFSRAADQDSKAVCPEKTAREFRPQVGSITCVMPLSSAKGRPEEARFRRHDKQVETSWTFSLNFAMSQGLHVINDASASDAERAEAGGALRLYAKTAWRLPDTKAEMHREAALAELVRRRARAVMFIETFKD